MSRNCPNPVLNGITKDWSEHFGGSVWPDPSFSEELTAITTAGYLAIAFNTGNVLEDGGITAIEHTSTQGARLVSISECPGDFVDYLPESANDCSRLFRIGGSLKWNTYAGGLFGQCDLESNKTYYLNVTFTDGLDPATNQCTGTSSCRTYLRVWY